MPRYFTPGEARAALVLCVLAALGAWLGWRMEDRAREQAAELPSISADSLALRLVERELARRNAPVRINSALPAELTRLEGIGPALADRIVAERESGGPFSGPEELAARVSGIGPATVIRLEARLEFGDSTGVDGK